LLLYFFVCKDSACTAVRKTLPLRYVNLSLIVGLLSMQINNQHLNV